MTEVATGAKAGARARDDALLNTDDGTFRERWNPEDKGAC